MGYKLNEDGILVDEETNAPVEINGQPVKLDGMVSKEQATSVMQERLGKQKKELEGRIKALEDQTSRTPELEKHLQETRDLLRDTEAKFVQAKEEAAKEVAQQMTQLANERDRLRADLETEKQGRMQEQLTNDILSKCKDRFINPASDIVPKLLQTHKREAVKDEMGQPTGEFVDSYTLTWKDEKGNEITKALSSGDALEVLQSHPDFQHYVKASGNTGSGGGAEFKNIQNLKRSEMTPSEKAAFVSKHGEDAFKEVPE